jgi:ATP-dependent Lon protease
MALSIYSTLSNKKIKQNIAMTGELTLSFDVLPIGGLKEKAIAGHKAGIKTIIIPKKNYEIDLKDIPDEVKKDIEFIGVSTFSEVLKIIFESD